MTANYSIKSTSELIDIAKSVNKRRILSSLDVEYLSANYPVITTIDIIIDDAYNHNNYSLIISKDLVNEFLIICSTKTLFKLPNGNIYIRKSKVYLWA